VHDPRVGVEHLARTGALKPSDRDEIDELYETSGRPTIWAAQP
jgi:hypothetical protein